MNRDEEITLKLTVREILMLRECLRYITKHTTLGETFGNEDYDWCEKHDQDPYECEQKPTDKLETKFAVYTYPDNDEHVIAVIKKTNS